MLRRKYPATGKGPVLKKTPGENIEQQRDQWEQTETHDQLESAMEKAILGTSRPQTRPSRGGAGTSKKPQKIAPHISGLILS